MAYTEEIDASVILTLYEVETAKFLTEETTTLKKAIYKKLHGHQMPVRCLVSMDEIRITRMSLPNC
jgi:hypothetical protein